ncbi:MAG: EamA family transporter [Chloroflexi bacterium]|nr:EamA family transporter [Chloroflexota bacterium]MBI2976887.1 EamA family transporter [Chloroflexota bacterium]MBI5291010.1 EamA family transporter [Chloroflexota bacterium]
MTLRAKGILIALAGTTVWATTGIIISYLLKHYTLQPLTLAFWRDLIIACTMLLLLRVARPEALRITRRDIPFFLLYGFVGLAAFNGMWTFSVQFNGAAVATVLAYSSPAFTVLLARPLLKEPLTLRKLAAVALSIVGCVFVARAYTAEAWRVNPVGIAVGLGTGLAFACYSLAGRWSSNRFTSPWTVTAYGFLFAATALGLTQNPDTLFTMKAWDGWAILILLAVGPSLVGFSLYTLSLRYLQASMASLIATLEPALTAVMAIYLLSEQLLLWQWIGAALILAAVVLVQQAEPARAAA